jgi:hypothetical protein
MLALLRAVLIAQSLVNEEPHPLRGPLMNLYPGSAWLVTEAQAHDTSRQSPCSLCYTSCQSQSSINNQYYQDDL